jgi:hypothetical protein
VATGEADEEESTRCCPVATTAGRIAKGFDPCAAPGCPEPGGAGSAANGYVEPIVATTATRRCTPSIRSASIARCRARRPTAGAVPRTTFWGDYYYGDLRLLTGGTGAWTNAAPVPGQPGTNWGTGFKACVDAALGPDGHMYWLQQITAPNLAGTVGALHRIRYTGATVDVPVDVPAASRLACAPNPVRGAAELRFRLPSAAKASVHLYDLSGRRVASLYDGVAPAGETRVTWDAGATAPGLYFARLSAGDRVDSERVLLLK